MDQNNQDQANAFAGGFFAAVLVGGVVAAFAAVAHQIDKLERKVRKSEDSEEMDEFSGKIVKVDRDKLRELERHDARDMDSNILAHNYAERLRAEQMERKHHSAVSKIVRAVKDATKAPSIIDEDDED